MMLMDGGFWSTWTSLAAGLFGGFSRLLPNRAQADATPAWSIERACQWYWVPAMRLPTVTVAVVAEFAKPLSKSVEPFGTTVAGLVSEVAMGWISICSL